MADRPYFSLLSQEPLLAISKRLRHEIFRRDNHTCQSCGAKAPDVKLEPDHVIPAALGGTDDPSNLQTLCEDCNSGKSATPPNAATIAKVADDAERWAQAIQAAAGQMLGDVKARNEARAAFDSKWREWSEGRPPLPRPMGWEMSVDQFLKAGLPLPILLDCVDIAMRARHVKADGLFKYMCAIAWKKVAELQAAARAAVAEAPTPEDGPRPDDFQDGRYHLAAELLEELDAEEQEKFRSEAQEYSEHPEDPSEVEITAATYAFSGAIHDRWRLFDAAENLLTFLPSDMLEACRDYAKDDWGAHTGEDPEDIDLLVQTVRELVRRRRFHEASAYLAHLPTEERGEWIACATTLLGASDDPSHQINVEIKAADYAQRVKSAGGGSLKGLCSGNGQHGAMCPAPAQYRMRLQECPGCPDECAGHPVCERHLERVMDGLIASKSLGKALVLLDFEEIPPHDPWGEPPF